MILFFYSDAQDIADSTEHVVTAREWNFNIEINTSGAGLWFQKGWTPDYYNKHFFEVGGVYNRHHIFLLREVMRPVFFARGLRLPAHLAPQALLGRSEYPLHTVGRLVVRTGFPNLSEGC